MGTNTLSYATPKSRPDRHSAAAGWSWGALILEAAYRGSVVAYAYHCSPTNGPLDDEHFQRNLGNKAIFVLIDVSILVVGACFGFLGCMPEHRKHWAAALAMGANVIAILFALGGRY